MKLVISFPTLTGGSGETSRTTMEVWRTGELEAEKSVSFADADCGRADGVMSIADDDKTGGFSVDLRWVTSVRASKAGAELKLKAPALFTDKGVRSTKEQAWQMPIELALRCDANGWKAEIAPGTFKWKRKWLGGKYTGPDTAFTYEGRLNNWLHQYKDESDQGVSIELSPFLPIKDLRIYRVEDWGCERLLRSAAFWL